MPSEACDPLFVGESMVVVVVVFSMLKSSLDSSCSIFAPQIPPFEKRYWVVGKYDDCNINNTPQEKKSRDSIQREGAKRRVTGGSGQEETGAHVNKAKRSRLITKAKQGKV